MRYCASCRWRSPYNWFGRGRTRKDCYRRFRYRRWFR